MMKHLHFIGIGGIGMSALAAMFRENGWRVTGSDRAADRPENRRIFDALKLQGVTIFPQDGSYLSAGRPDALVYSTAIEEDNPDFAAGTGIERLHRSQVLAMALSSLLPAECRTVAVTGSCGKSTVTAHAAEALTNLGADPGCLNGALSKRFAGGRFAGNYRPGAGRFFVFEADESDRSLLNYGADYAVILNLGTDHYDRDELVRVFGAFLANVRRGAVLGGEVFEALSERGLLPPSLPVRAVWSTPKRGADDAVLEYRVARLLESAWEGGRRLRVTSGNDRPDEDRSGVNNFFNICGMRGESRIERRVPLAAFTGDRRIELPQPGEFMAFNALAVEVLLETMGWPRSEAVGALERFDGVWRRNDFAGNTPAGTPVFDDYAHNPEKIRSCLRLMREFVTGKLFAVFQPHGYGPFGFMRDQLFLYLEDELRPGDRFFVLEPYYAGGTTSFKPSAEEVVADWRRRAKHPDCYQTAASRDALRDYLVCAADADDLIVVMGARDNSLSDYAAGFASGATALPPGRTRRRRHCQKSDG